MSPEKIKLCPECGSEYCAHILTCADCGIPLKMPEEVEKKGDKKPNAAEHPPDEWVAIREEGREGIRELSDLLLRNGIPSQIALPPGCGTGKCERRYLLLVAKNEANIAHDCIENFYAQKYPDIKTSQEWSSQGRCPACGYGMSPDTKACPDCGIVFMGEG